MTEFMQSGGEAGILVLVFLAVFAVVGKALGR